MGVNEGLQRRRRAPRNLMQKQRVSEPAERQIELIASGNRNAVLLQRLPARVDLAELLRTRWPDPARVVVAESGRLSGHRSFRPLRELLQVAAPLQRDGVNP